MIPRAADHPFLPRRLVRLGPEECRALKPISGTKATDVTFTTHRPSTSPPSCDHLDPRVCCPVIQSGPDCGCHQRIGDCLLRIEPSWCGRDAGPVRCPRCARETPPARQIATDRGPIVVIFVRRQIARVGKALLGPDCVQGGIRPSRQAPRGRLQYYSLMGLRDGAAAWESNSRIRVMESSSRWLRRASTIGLDGAANDRVAALLASS